MRLPLILILAIVLLTPANIHDVAWKAVGQLETAVGFAHPGEAGPVPSTQVASLK